MSTARINELTLDEQKEIQNYCNSQMLNLDTVMAGLGAVTSAIPLFSPAIVTLTGISTLAFMERERQFNKCMRSATIKLLLLKK